MWWNFWKEPTKAKRFQDLKVNPVTRPVENNNPVIMSELDLNTIKKYDFPLEQYFQEDIKKTQIFLHHTAGRGSGEGVFNGWKSNKDRVATCVAISRDKGINGQIVQGYSSKYWAYHLGLKSSTFEKFGIPFKWLDKTSIGIEICNWGCLTKTARGYESWANVIVPEEDVYTYEQPFRGYKYYQKYTDEQIESVRQLLVYWNKIYGIPIEYKGYEIFDVDPRSLKGETGVYTHCSVRYDKTDIHPQPEMIQMLESLKSI